MYAICEVHSGDWWSDSKGWTHAGDEATLFDTRREAEEQARENCQARTIVVVECDDDPEKGLPPLP
jgi:hypothetical protein